MSQTFQTWRVEARTTIWLTNNNWWNFPNNSPIVFGQQEWDNNHFIQQQNNSDISTWRFLFKSGANESHTFSGSKITFFDFSTQNPSIINQSVGLHNIDNNIEVGSGGLWIFDIIASHGSLTFGGTFTHNTSKIIFLQGNNSGVSSNRAINLNGIISGNGSIHIINDAMVRYGAIHSYTGATNIIKGELIVNSSADISGSVINVGSVSNTSSTAKFFLGAPNGNQIFSREFQVKNGAGSTRFIGSLNSSGTNTISGAILRDSDTSLNIEVVNSTGILEISNVINQSGSLVNAGAGTTILTGANTYTGATIVNAGTLQLNRVGGNTIPTTNTITVNSGATLRISSNQSLNELNLDGGTILIDTGVTLTVETFNVTSGSITGTGNLRLNQVLNKTTNDQFNTNGQLILTSNLTSTARVGQIVGTITGNVTVERYIPAERAWRLLTAPLKGASNTSIFSNWQGTNNEGLLLWHPQGGGTTGLAVGPQANIWTHTGTAWSSVANTNTTQLFDANGNNAFLVFATGSHGSGYIASGQAATTTRARGDLISGNVSHSLIANQYKLIGNPYASPIDTEALVTSNSGSKIWLVDPTLGSFGGYVTHDGSNWSIPTPSGNDRYIQSGQGFFVRSASNITFTINESHKVTGNSNTWFERNANSLENSESTDRIRVLLYKQEDNQWKLADGILAVNSAGGNDEVDEVDSGKISNFNESLMFRNSNTNLSIEYRDLPSLERVQPMRLTSTTSQPYQLKVYTEHYSNSNLQPVIEDTQSGTFTPIPMNGEEIIIPFSGIVASATQPDMRFRIVYQSILSAEEFTEIATAVYPNPVQEGWFNVELKNMKPNTTYTLSNLLGQEVQSGFLEFQKNQIVINKELQGVYLLKITQDGKSATTKLIIK